MSELIYSIRKDGRMATTFINEVHYVRIPVKDIDESIKWYTELLGFKLLAVTEEGYAIIKVNDGSFLLTLVPTEDDTYAHFTIGGEPAFSIGFASPNLREFHQHLLDHGATVADIEDDNGHQYFHFYDPSGNKLQVHW